LSDINSLIDAGLYEDASAAIKDTVSRNQTGPELRGFGSLFGGVSPQEDFVEVLRLLAVRKAGTGGTAILRTLTMGGPGTPASVEILDHLSDTGMLKEKADCVASLNFMERQ
jgi:hypothetical protein